MKTYTNLDGVECVIIENEDGTIWSGLKSAYDEQLRLMKPRLSKSAVQLREQIDDAFPDRDRTSDGWIGDTRHAARKSDHNPDEQGWVRAIDVDRDLSGKAKPDIMPDLADQIRLYGKAHPKRISYVIFEGKIAS